jgi:hypothetical protein
MILEHGARTCAQYSLLLLVSTIITPSRGSTGFVQDLKQQAAASFQMAKQQEGLPELFSRKAPSLKEEHVQNHQMHKHTGPTQFLKALRVLRLACLRSTPCY